MSEDMKATGAQVIQLPTSSVGSPSHAPKENAKPAYHKHYRSLGSSAKLWVIGSGKGGVGKSFITSGLGITLSKLGYNVLLVDFDLAGANLHTVLGSKPSHLNIRHYFEAQKKISDLVIPTEVPRLSYIQGFWDSWTPNQYTRDESQALLKDLKKLRYDVILVDLGNGASEINLDFFQAADDKILVSTPEPTSVERTYRFIEAYICFCLQQTLPKDIYQDLVSTLRQYRQRSLSGNFSFPKYLRDKGLNPETFEVLSRNPVRLLVNQSRSQQNNDLGFSIKSVARKYYDLGIDFVGAVEYDNAVWQSVRSREHVLFAQPFTTLAGQLMSVSKHLIDPQELAAVG